MDMCNIQESTLTGHSGIYIHRTKSAIRTTHASQYLQVRGGSCFAYLSLYVLHQLHHETVRPPEHVQLLWNRRHRLLCCIYVFTQFQRSRQTTKLPRQHTRETQISRAHAYACTRALQVRQERGDEWSSPEL